MSVAAVLLLAFFFRGTDFSALLDAVASADPALIAVAGAVIMVSYLLRAIRWRFLLAPVGKPGLGACFVTTVIGFMVNFLAPTGRLGEVVRPYLLARREGFSASSAFATIFLERVLDLMTVVFLVGTWLLLGPPPEGAKSQAAVQALQLGGFTVFVGAAVGLAIMFAFVRDRERAVVKARALAAWLPDRLEEITFRFLKAFGEGLSVLADGGNLARAAVMSIFLWLNISLAFWIGASAFDIRFPFGATFLVIGFLTVGVAVPTPGAVGGYHVMCALALTLLFGVDEPRAKAAALVNHAIAFVPVAVLGIFFFIREGLSLKDVQTIGGSGKER